MAAVTLSREQVAIARDLYGDPDLTMDDVQGLLRVEISNPERAEWLATLGRFERRGNTREQAVRLLFEAICC